MLIYILIFIEDKLIQITPMALKMALMALKCYLIKNRLVCQKELFLECSFLYRKKEYT